MSYENQTLDDLESTKVRAIMANIMSYSRQEIGSRFLLSTNRKLHQPFHMTNKKFEQSSQDARKPIAFPLQ